MKEYKVFDVVIGGQKREVWKRKEEHKLGEWNGCPKNWWVNLGTVEKPEWEPWIDKGTNRPVWDISIKTDNRTKVKWGEVGIRGTGLLTISCNQRQVYEQGFNDISYAMSKAQVLMTEMMEHPFDFCNPDSMLGKKIWYKNQPAIITGLSCLDHGCILIEKEAGGKF
jgi:hypothetical protein